MADPWKTVFTARIEERDVEGQIYYDGGDYRVVTTQLDDYAGRPEPGSDETTNNRATTAVPVAIAARSPINVDGATLPQLRAALIEADFSQAAAAIIVSKFPAPPAQ